MLRGHFEQWVMALFVLFELIYLGLVEAQKTCLLKIKGA